MDHYRQIWRSPRGRLTGDLAEMGRSVAAHLIYSMSIQWENTVWGDFRCSDECALVSLSDVRIFRLLEYMTCF
jgi:hypothetical protein